MGWKKREKEREIIEYTQQQTETHFMPFGWRLPPNTIKHWIDWDRNVLRVLTKTTDKQG